MVGYCPAVYDAALPQPKAGGAVTETHTCDLDREHIGAHHCDLCDRWWTARMGAAGGRGAGSGIGDPVKKQVARARMDAHLIGTGFVKITRGEGGVYEYERLRPDRVVVKAAETEDNEKDGVTE